MMLVASNTKNTGRAVMLWMARRKRNKKRAIVDIAPLAYVIDILR